MLIVLWTAVTTLTAVESTSDKTASVANQMASSLTVEVESTTALVGETVKLKVRGLGLPAGSAAALGAYDFRVDFDGALLALQSIDFGSSLGDAGEVVHMEQTSASQGEAASVSLLAPGTLVSHQSSDTLPLFELTFETLAQGVSQVTLVPNAGPGDENGNLLNAELLGGAVTIERDPTQGPPVEQIPTLSEWGLILLFVLCAALGLRRLRLRDDREVGA